MSIQNVKVQYIRSAGYQNLETWMASDSHVYIGRAGVVFIDGQRFPKVASPFCNPFKIGKDGTRTDVLQKYKKYILEKLDQSAAFRTELLGLKNKTLGCWCHPELCHGDILLELIANLKF